MQPSRSKKRDYGNAVLNVLRRCQGLGAHPENGRCFTSARFSNSCDMSC